MRVCAAPDIQGAIARPGNTRSGLASGSRSEPSESQRREYLRSTDAPESARQLSLRGAQLPHLRSHRSRIDNRDPRLITPRASSAVSASTHHECIHHGPPSIERCGLRNPTTGITGCCRAPLLRMRFLWTGYLSARHDFWPRPLYVGTHPTVTTCKANTGETPRFLRFTEPCEKCCVGQLVICACRPTRRR